MSVILSIITPTLNEYNRIRAFVEGVAIHRDSCRFEVEHIIVDGGSSDGTRDLLKKMKEEGLVTNFFVAEQSTIYQAMNMGATKAQGEVLTFMNVDDSYEPLALQSSTEPIVSDDADYVFSNARMFDRLHSFTRYPYFGAAGFRALYCHQTLFVKKTVFDAHGAYDENLKLFADADLMTGLYLSGHQYKYLDKILVNYQLGGASHDYLLFNSIENTYLVKKWCPILLERIKENSAGASVFFWEFCNFYKYIIVTYLTKRVPENQQDELENCLRDVWREIVESASAFNEKERSILLWIHKKFSPINLKLENISILSILRFNFFRLRYKLSDSSLYEAGQKPLLIYSYSMPRLGRCIVSSTLRIFFSGYSDRVIF
jgi:glycosyltransferase involved in cell wall biosynthesis